MSGGRETAVKQIVVKIGHPKDPTIDCTSFTKMVKTTKTETPIAGGKAL